MSIGKLTVVDRIFSDNVLHLDISFDYDGQELAFTLTVDEENGVFIFDPNSIYKVLEDPKELDLDGSVKLSSEELQFIEKEANLAAIKYLVKMFRVMRSLLFQKKQLRRYKLLKEECDKRGISLEELSEATSVPLKAIESLKDPSYQHDLFLDDVDAICSHLGISGEAWVSNVFPFSKQ